MKKQNNTYKVIILLSVLAGILLSGCMKTGFDPVLNTEGLDTIHNTLKDSQQQNAAKKPQEQPPEAVMQAMIPPLGITRLDAQGAEDRFDVSVDKMTAPDFFYSLVQGTQYNIIVHPDVAGVISLDLRNVTLDEVMHATRDVFGYEYQKNGSLYQVMPNSLKTVVFQVNYLNMHRVGSSSMTVSSGGVSSTSGDSGDDNSSSDSGNGNNSSSSNSGEGNGTMIESSTDADLWKELANALKIIVGDKEGRSVVVTPQAGVVVVRAMPDEIRAVREYLEGTELIMARQVVLEAKVLEVSLNDGFDAGINWSVIFNKDNTASLGSTAIAPTGGAGGVFSAALNLGDFTGLISLLEEQGTVQVLSSPRIATLNNQKAVIKVGSDEYFVTGASSTTTTAAGGAVTSNPNFTLEPFFSGVALDVTPQISEKNEIILHVHPTVSRVEDDTKTITYGGQTSTLPLASSTIRESDSVVHARNGQVIVVGGLMQNLTTDTNTDTPFLGKIPVLGALFKQKRQSSNKSELVVLLKPVIVDPAGNAWQSDLSGSQQRIDKMQNSVDASNKNADE